MELAEAVCELEGWELVEKANKVGFERYGIKFRRPLIVFGIDCMNGREEEYTFSLR